MQKESPKPYEDKRPWGEELWIKGQSPSMVKVITVFPDQALSLQYHKNRDEYWYIIQGDGKAIVDNTETDLHPGVDCFVSRNQKHRIIGGKEKLVLLELTFGEFDENDIVRLEDRYGRV